MSKFKLSVAIAILIGALGSSAEATSVVQMDDIGTVVFSGEIQSGDAERIAAALIAIKPAFKDVYVLPHSLEINSKGGDVKEALKVAALVKATFLHVNVISRGRGVCASSCFFVFLAGQKRVASGIDTIAQEGAARTLGPLGIHRPYYRAPEGGPASAKKQEDTMREVATYLQSERVAQYLIDEMMAHASNNIYWLTSRDLKSLGSYQAGVEEEIISKCGYDSQREAQMSRTEWIKDNSAGGVGDCVTAYLVNTYGPLRQAAVARLRQGWRPWKN